MTNIRVHGGVFSGILNVGDGPVTQNNGAGGELTGLIAAVIDAARGTAVEDRINNLMAQLQLVEEDEPDETIVGKVLDRAQTAATNAGAAALVQAVMRLGK